LYFITITNSLESSRTNPYQFFRIKRIAQANAYDDRIYKLLQIKTAVPSFGADEILSIIDWLFKKFKEGQDSFYKKVEWASWKTVVDGGSSQGQSK